MKLSIIIPVLDEGERIRASLEALAPLRRHGHEVIVVDGGSSDGTAVLAAPLCDRVAAAARGRAVQMNAGARHATGDALLFLHVDTALPREADRLVAQTLQKHLWGRFDVEIEGHHRLLKVVGWAMNLRSRLTGIATGDQAIFVRRDAFAAVGGVPPLQLMEDVALCAALKRISPPLCLNARVTTSGRRWESRGVLRTVLLMWWLRLRYFFGTSPARLAEIYRHHPR